MTASFAAQLCGYRASGTPSTSDASEEASIAWGRALFDELGVDDGAVEVPNVGARLEELATAEIAAAVPDHVVGRSQLIRSFEQYRHLGVFDSFRDRYDGSTVELERALQLLEPITPRNLVSDARRELKKALRKANADRQHVAELMMMSPEESLLRLDITVGSTDNPPKLIAGFSCKWSLRTDRAQDCLAQGAKLVANRRGRMPHYATVTMEPRPSMLRLLAYGSGSLDCVYHLALPELRSAARKLAAAKHTKPWAEARNSIERMVTQGRLRDYNDLIAEMRGSP